MIRRAVFLALAAGALAGVTAVQAQPYPMVDKLAQKVIAKYQTSSCADLAAKRGAPPSAMETRAVTFLRGNAGARTQFINEIAAPVANKLFECGLIP